MNIATVNALVDSELAASADPRVHMVFGRLRIAPRSELRPWPYPPPEKLECWIVMEDSESRTAIAYCSAGFGPKCPWGLLWMGSSGRPQHIGDDSQWFATLAMAVRDSFAWDA